MTTSSKMPSFPRLCGLLGNKPSRLSQAMHNAAFSALGLDFVFVAFDTLNTAAGLQAMRELGLRGLSLTIPHKEAAIKLVDELSSEAAQIAAINTVVNDNGKLLGENTDWYGVTAALVESGFKSDSEKVALVYGTGGAARAALFALNTLKIGRVIVSGRNTAKAKLLAEEFKSEFLDQSELTNGFFSGLNLFINATPIGLDIAGPGASYPFSVDVFVPGQTVVFEMVTKETALVSSARASEVQVISGSRMLLHQAVRQFELFTGKQAPVKVMEQALLSELK